VGREVPEDVHDICWESILERFDPQEVFVRTGVHISIKPQVGYSTQDLVGSHVNGPIFSASH
jgi:hypothetical protein